MKQPTAQEYAQFAHELIKISESRQKAATLQQMEGLRIIFQKYKPMLAQYPHLQKEADNLLVPQVGRDYKKLEEELCKSMQKTADWLSTFNKRAREWPSFYTQTRQQQIMQHITLYSCDYAQEVWALLLQPCEAFVGWQKHGLNGGILEITASQWAALTDGKTGLMWAVNSGQADFPNRGNLTWQAAHDWVKSVNQKGWCGYYDWRLPSIEELKTLVLQKNGAYDLTRYQRLFTESFATQWFWSSSPCPNYGNYAWNVYFFNGGDNYYVKDSNPYVRLVRTGQ